MLFFMKKRRFDAEGWLGCALKSALAAVLLVCALLPLASGVANAPDTLRLREGGQWEWDFLLPVKTQILDNQQVISSTDERLGVKLTAQEEGNASLQFSFMGVPMRTIEVSVEPRKVLIPGGHSIGVAIRTKGVLVVGMSDLGGAVKSPARQAGVKAGDWIEAVNGQAVTDSEQLSQLVNDQSGDILLTVSRNGEQRQVTLNSETDVRDGVRRLGVWVRDSTAGVGTLSFYDPESGNFGALGHPITDVDTGQQLTVGQGEILKSQVVRITPGEKGQPGELMGSFLDQAESWGSVDKNTQVGIYGTCSQPIENPLFPNGVEMLSSDEVRQGAAQILTTLEGDEICAYDCEITKISHQRDQTERNMVVRITDEALLQKTGGIVQGMSGSPILQDGKLAGAVTHVLVNDPTMGYGIFIENMLEAAG